MEGYLWRQHRQVGSRIQYRSFCYISRGWPYHHGGCFEGFYRELPVKPINTLIVGPSPRDVFAVQITKRAFLVPPAAIPGLGTRLVPHVPVLVVGGKLVAVVLRETIS